LDPCGVGRDVLCVEVLVLGSSSVGGEQSGVLCRMLVLSRDGDVYEGGEEGGGGVVEG
jgi:hypothetical protein